MPACTACCSVHCRVQWTDIVPLLGPPAPLGACVLRSCQLRTRSARWKFRASRSSSLRSGSDSLLRALTATTRAAKRGLRHHSRAGQVHELYRPQRVAIGDWLTVASRILHDPGKEAGVREDRDIFDAGLVLILPQTNEVMFVARHRYEGLALVTCANGVRSCKFNLAHQIPAIRQASTTTHVQVLATHLPCLVSTEDWFKPPCLDEQRTRRQPCEGDVCSSHG